MSRPPAASTTPAWFATAAPVANTGPEVVGPTGVAVGEPLGAEEVKVPLPTGIEAPPVGAGIEVVGDTAVPEGVVIDVPEEQGTVMVVPRVTIVVYDVTVADVLALTEEEVLVEVVEVLAVVTVVTGVQFGRVKVPL